MGDGSEERQEGNYASSAQSISGGISRENDLGLTLLPGSQIGKRCEGQPPSDTRVCNDQHRQQMSGVADVCSEEKGSHRSRELSSPSLERNRDVEKTDAENSVVQSQAITYVSKKGTTTGNRSKHLSSEQTSMSQLEILTCFGDGRLRYSRRVRASIDTQQEDGVCKKRKFAISQGGDDTCDMISVKTPGETDASASRIEQPTSMGPFAEEDKQALPTPSPSLTPIGAETSSSLLVSGSPPPRAFCSTAVYPECSKRRSSNCKRPSLDISPSPRSPTSFKEESLVDYGMRGSPTPALKLLQAELKETREDLFKTVQTESDGRHAMYELGKAYNNLLATERAHLELQKKHASFLEEHRRLLKSYDTLANVHAACRSTSSRKLAQRIIDAAPPPRRPAQAYPSPSPSTTAYPNWDGSYINPSTMVQSPEFAPPLIDLTKSPLPDQATHLLSSDAQYISLPERDESRKRDDANYANINGFDDEANEMFDAFWESEMRNLSGQAGEATERGQ